MIRIITLSLVFLAQASWLSAQDQRQTLREGNQRYEEGQYDEAEVRYRETAGKSKSLRELARFNLGDALYKQERYEEASREFSELAQRQDLPEDLRASALHNLGNSLVQQKQYKEAIDAYKQSLRLRPGDEETRENLARTLMQMQQQQNQQNQQDQQDKDNQEDPQQEKDREDQSQNEQDQQQNGQDERQEQPNQNDTPREESGERKAGQMSKEEARRLLEALSKKEEKIQEKLQRQQQKDEPARSNTKDW